MILSEDQILFLKINGISRTEVLDATGMRSREYREIMKIKRYKVAIGVTKCKSFGHTMRSSSGHCVQCNSLSLVYTSRHRQNNFIYIAWSQAKKLSKIGITSNLSQRHSTLIKQRYGGISDWTIFYSKFVSNAGVIESKVLNDLSKFLVAATTYKNKNNQKTYELINCPADIVTSCVKKYLD
jgi:hypothetical protein